MEDTRKGTPLWDYPKEHLAAIKDGKVCHFAKFETILLFFCCLLDPFTKKHYRAWNSIINLSIDSRTSKKYIIVLSAKQRSNNYLELSKENVLGNMMLPHWPCFTWKLFMIWFHKIPKLIFQKQLNIEESHLFFTAFLKIFL